MPSQRMSRRLLRSAATLAAAMVFYYFVPLPDERFSIVGVLLFLAGLAALTFLVLVQVRRQLRAPENESVRVNSLLVMLYLVIVFFSLAYVQIERMTPGEFAELETRTDALYFTVATLGTVGYGDVHPVGQMARIFATAQIVFDLVFVALLVSVFSNRVGRVVAARRVSGGD
ncbi:MAG TPA: potassium channel family protein [Acidothermales bacterium]